LAEKNFKKALAIDPKLSSACNGLGAAYKQIGRSDDAITYWQKALVIKPDYDFPLINLGILFLEKGQFRQAIDYFQKYKEKFYFKLTAAEKLRVDRLIAEAGNKLQTDG